jgi:preprotein translocase subunit SecG
MYVLLVVIHVFVAFVMIGSILLQSGKGAEIGATFGGSSQTIFGGRGATPFLVKFTVGCAVLFMVTSLFLAILSKGRSVGTSLKLPAAPSATAPPADSSASSGAAPSLPSAEPSGAPPSVPTTPAPVTP